MVEAQKPQAALLIGNGSRITPLIEQAAAGMLSGNIVAVVTHKYEEFDGDGYPVDVAGIAVAKAHDIPTKYLDWTAFRREAAIGGLNREECRPLYFDMVHEFLTADGRSPSAIFMLGWDVIAPPSFLNRWPSPKPGITNVFNLHPALKPRNPGEDFYVTETVLSGTRIPYLMGEHDEVLAAAFDQKLPVLGATIHYAIPEFDEGPAIKRVEVPILPEDTIPTYDEGLKTAEEQLVIEVFEMWATGEIDRMMASTNS